MLKLPRRMALAIAVFTSTGVVAQNQSEAQQKRTREPVHRVAKVTNANVPTTRSSAAEEDITGDRVPAKSATFTKKGHALDSAIDFASQGLVDIQKDLFDYTGMLVKRERVNGKLSETEYIKFKIRNARVVNGKKIPFSIYLRFLRPESTRGREVIWVEGRNNNKITAHEATNSMLRRFTANLDPNGSMAMKGNRYPIYEAGIEKLVEKLIEKGTRDRAAGECIVNYKENASIQKRGCKLIEVIHPEKMQPYEFWKAKIYIDKELNLPVRYACWDWPVGNQKKGKLIEEYTYVNLQLNVGLTDRDFDPKNPEYDYSK